MKKSNTYDKILYNTLIVYERFDVVVIGFCGTDIIEVERIKQAILNTDGFKEKVYTSEEINVGDKKSEIIRYQYYAGRFAAKEAVYKALSKEYGDKICFLDIEILNDANCKERPYVNILNNDVLQDLNMGKLQIDVSISHINDYAIANCYINILDI